MNRFYAPRSAFSAKRVVLDKGETRHLRNVLRMHVGDEVGVFDGEGNEFLCVIAEIGKNSAELNVRATIEPAAPESPLDLTVAAAVTPGEKFDLAIQKSVELGVTRFVPLSTDRTEVRSKDAERRLERWRRISFEAAKQCGRARLMGVEPVSTVDIVCLETKGPLVIFSERDGSSFDSIELADHALTVVYGPKGGWSDRELETARVAGAIVVTFGGRILRAETAAIAITAILQHRFGDMR